MVEEIDFNAQFLHFQLFDFILALKWLIAFLEIP